MKRDPRDKIRDPDCQLCPLHKSAEHVCLLGDGPMPARVLVIGEAPGEREDEEHRAFVGPAGKLLDELLAGVGIRRDQVYITNAARCRPPKNRTPDRKEVKICTQEYFPRELDLVDPEFILTLGNPALQAMTGNSGIRKHRGLVKPLNAKAVGLQGGVGLPLVFPTYHPAFALRNPSIRPEIEADLQRFARMLRGEGPKTETKVRIVRTGSQLRWLLHNLKHADVISWDIETYTHGYNNLHEWRGKRSMIVSVAFCWKAGEAAVLPLWHHTKPWRDPESVLKLLKPVMERDDCKYIAHNGKFDARWMAAKGIHVPQTFDTMLAAHMLDENRSKGLKNLSQLLLGADAYDVGEDLSDAYHMPLKKLCVYNGKDADYTLRLYHILREQLMKEPRIARVFTMLMMPAANALVDVERKGIWMDSERWEERYGVAQENVAKLQRYIERYSSAEEINLNSPQQVARLLFKDLNLSVVEKTGKGAPSTREAVLLRLAKKHKVPKAMIKHRKWNKRITTYFTPWRFDHSDHRDRVHSSYKLFGTVTGRLSSEGGIQQVPRDPFMRSIFGAPEGRKFVQADYSQIELRIAAMLAHERRMLRMYAAGEDLHMNTAVEMTRKRAGDVEKEERKKAKAVNFGFLYGMGPNKFVDYAFENYDVEVSPEEAKKFRARFFASYPSLRSWHERQKRLAHRYKRVHSPLGRVRHLPDIDSHDEKIQGEAERQAINSPVQATATDLMLIALTQLHNELDPRMAWIVGTIHDSILFDIDDDYLDESLPIIKETMEDMSIVRKKFGADITVPIVADLEVGQHWSEGKVWTPEAV